MRTTMVVVFSFSATVGISRSRKQFSLTGLRLFRLSPVFCRIAARIDLAAAILWPCRCCTIVGPRLWSTAELFSS
ncbi:hypothetical protein L6452_42266 [Arctium lappa]|uniref:Uncharacterized protein n=1 Tax=Arctium lappa TaxID=4217 RepID=A0ACB8XJ16_ARCLA|nr:hypothetical protein L6452_42266 [Arctium lappa]